MMSSRQPDLGSVPVLDWKRWPREQLLLPLVVLVLEVLLGKVRPHGWHLEPN